MWFNRYYLFSFSSLVCYFSSQNQSYHNYYWLDFAISFKRISCLNKVKVKKTPSSATVKYSTADAAVASVSNGVITAIDNLNGVTNYDGVDYAAKGYAKLVVSENDANGASKCNGLNWSAGTATHLEADDLDYAKRIFDRDYVTSQQVSLAGSDEHKVAFAGGLPYITLPSDSAALNSGKTFQQDVNLTVSTENTYATDAQYITLKDVKPNELTYATMNFASLSLSKYTRLDTWKTYADNNKIVLTFTQDILASSVIVDQSTVKRDGANANSEIVSVTVSGKSIIITLKHPITDGIAADFTVTMNKANVGGIEYNVVTTNGDKVVNAATNYIIHNDTNSKNLMRLNQKIKF